MLTCVQRCTQSLRLAEHQEGKGRKKECREEAHQAGAVQRGPLRKANLPPWHGRPAVKESSHLWATSEQGLSLTLRLQALNRKIWGGHTGIWTQGCGPCGMSSRRGDGCLH